MKIIYSGLESSGKSLKLAMVAEELVIRNSKWKQQSGKERAIASNMLFTEKFTRWAESMGVPIRYWENIDELVAYSDVDVIIDEVGVYFDSRLWSDLSVDVRRWLAQGAKSGIEMYGAAQDFAQVDLSFRRLVNNLFYIQKVIGSERPSATKPPIKKVWGICMVHELDPKTYDESDDKFKGLSLFSFRWFTIKKKYCEIFDTGQKLKRSKPLPFKHIERTCELNPKCLFHREIHV